VSRQPGILARAAWVDACDRLIAQVHTEKRQVAVTLRDELSAREFLGVVVRRRWEICNAFSAMLKRNRITLAQALQAIQIYYQIPIRFADVELADSLTIAARLGIYAYDAYLIRCALKYNASLLSLDKNLIRVAQQINVNVIEVR